MLLNSNRSKSLNALSDAIGLATMGKVCCIVDFGYYRNLNLNLRSFIISRIYKLGIVSNPLHRAVVKFFKNHCIYFIL